MRLQFTVAKCCKPQVYTRVYGGELSNQGGPEKVHGKVSKFDKRVCV